MVPPDPSTMPEQMRPARPDAEQVASRSEHEGVKNHARRSVRHRRNGDVPTGMIQSHGYRTHPHEENTMSHDPIEQALAHIAAVQGAEKVILFVDPWSEPDDGRTMVSTICSPSELSIGSSDAGGDAIIVGTEAKATLTCFVNQTDDYLILPIERLTGEGLETALASIRSTLAAISVENDGRCGYAWDIFDNRKVATDTSFQASDLLRVETFAMADDEDRQESCVEMFFADGRAARLRGGMDWYNAMC
jgi:hypothetical protein